MVKVNRAVKNFCRGWLVYRKPLCKITNSSIYFDQSNNIRRQQYILWSSFLRPERKFCYADAPQISKRYHIELKVDIFQFLVYNKTVRKNFLLILYGGGSSIAWVAAAPKISSKKILPLARQDSLFIYSIYF